jgi:transposase
MSMWELLLEIKHAVEDARACGKDALEDELKGGFYVRYAQVLDEGLSLNPAQERAREERRPLPEGQAAKKGRRGRVKQTKTYNLLIRMQQKRDEVLRFMTDFNVPFDNNGAERDIRMMKLQQKTSACFRTSTGTTIFCRIRSYISTARKQGYNILAAVHAALCGSPIRLTAQA